MELNQIKEKLDKKAYNFFNRLEQQLELPLYFVGSITRIDYIKGKSDLDIEVFSENVISTKYKIHYLLNYFLKKPKYIVFKINGTLVSGYKYYLKKENFRFDFTIYKKESQELLLYQRNIETNIPLYLTFFLITIKYLYYYLNIFSSNQYSFIKRKFWVLYNGEKTAAKTYDNDGYVNYIFSENSDKKYLI